MIHIRTSSQVAAGDEPWLHAPILYSELLQVLARSLPPCSSQAFLLSQDPMPVKEEIYWTPKPIIILVSHISYQSQKLHSGGSWGQDSVTECLEVSDESFLLIVVFQDDPKSIMKWPSLNRTSKEVNFRFFEVYKASQKLYWIASAAEQEPEI